MTNTEEKADLIRLVCTCLEYVPSGGHSLERFCHSLCFQLVALDEEVDAYRELEYSDRKKIEAIAYQFGSFHLSWHVLLIAWSNKQIRAFILHCMPSAQMTRPLVCLKSFTLMSLQAAVAATATTKTDVAAMSM